MFEQKLPTDNAVGSWAAAPTRLSTFVRLAWCPPSGNACRHSQQLTHATTTAQQATDKLNSLLLLLQDYPTLGTKVANARAGQTTFSQHSHILTCPAGLHVLTAAAL